MKGPWLLGRQQLESSGSPHDISFHLVSASRLIPARDPSRWSGRVGGSDRFDRYLGLFTQWKQSLPSNGRDSDIQILVGETSYCPEVLIYVKAGLRYSSSLILEAEKVMSIRRIMPG